MLFTIDQRPYTAALAEAQARVSTAQTQLALARSEYARAARLIDQEAVSQEEVDSLRASMKSGEASVAAALAAKLICFAPSAGAGKEVQTHNLELLG